MAETNSSLDKLVSGLSLDERQELLQKLTIHSHISQDLLYSEEQAETGLPAAEQLKQLSFFSRFWLSLLSLIKAKPPAKLYEDRAIAGIGKRIERIAPGVYDYKKDRLLAAFHGQLERLRDAARFFHAALDAGFNRDRKSFYGFLGSLEMDALHLRIEQETDAETVENLFPGVSPADLRKKAAQIVENTLGGITDENRAAMYSDSRSLFCLKELVMFPFDRILRTFSIMDTASGKLSCQVGMVREPLTTLNNILFSMKLIPPMPLLESIFVFFLGEEQKTGDLDREAELERLMNKAAECLETIRGFNRATPLTLILRCSLRNMSINPKEISGGEDWLALYRDYWKRRIDETFAARAGGIREQKLRNTFSVLIHGLTFKPLADAASAENPDGLPIRGAWTLAFLGAFYSAVFIPEMNEALNILLLEGNFILKEDSADFTESYDAFNTLQTNIRKFEKDISVEGDFGRRFQQLKQELNTQPMVKRRRLEAISDEASGIALGIIHTVYQASRVMATLLEKVTSIDAAGRYVALGNMIPLAAKYPDFLPALTGMPGQFAQLAQMLEDVDALEAGI
jgi:hypothetical protein